jgi:sec-independent protein translocase protein TatA
MPGGWEWMILLVVVMLLFGAKRLPEMAKAVGQSARVFKGEMKGMKSDGERDAGAARADINRAETDRAEAGRAETNRAEAEAAKPTDQELPPGAAVTERGGHTNGSR